MCASPPVCVPPLSVCTPPLCVPSVRVQAAGQQGNTAAPPPEEDVGLHFIAFVEHGGKRAVLGQQGTQALLFVCMAMFDVMLKLSFEMHGPSCASNTLGYPMRTCLA